MLRDIVAEVDWGTMLVAIISASGGVIVGWLTLRAKNKDDKQSLIDQLQEERNTYVSQLEKERADYMARIDRFWADKAYSREHVAELRDHIWQRNDPPPPKPPTGYIE
jgi:predicted house-cleaning noncanonical NTP pyrophosphatase (MazG superfamily)